MKWKLKGGHKQETRSGYNFWKPFTSQTKDGVTLTVKDDGSYVLSGTATKTTSFYVNGLNYDAADYTIALFNSTAMSNGTFYVQIEHENGLLKQAFLTTNTIKSGTTGKVNALSIVIPADLTLNNFTFKPMLLKGIYTANTMLRFEQYGMMPSTGYPSKIRTVGTGSAEMDVANENLFNKNNTNNFLNGLAPDNSGKIQVVSTNTSNSNYIVTIIVPCLPNSIYIISRYVEGKTFFVYESPKKDLKVEDNVTFLKRNDNTSIIDERVTTSANAKYLLVKIYNTYATEQNTYNDLISNVQVIKSSTISQFKEHTSQTAIMPIQQEMLQGDYIEDVEHHEWGKLVLKGDEGWGIVPSNPYQNQTTYFSTRKFDNLLKKEEVISNYFTYKKRLWEEDVEGIFCDVSRAYSLRIRVNKTIASTSSKLNAYLKARYDANDPVVIYYKLANAIDLELTEFQKAVREQKLHTYKNVTNINLSDELASIDVTYKKDLDTILNNLQAQIIANASEEVTE